MWGKSALDTRRKKLRKRLSILIERRAPYRRIQKTADELALLSTIASGETKRLLTRVLLIMVAMALVGAGVCALVPMRSTSVAATAVVDALVLKRSDVDVEAPLFTGVPLRSIRFGTSGKPAALCEAEFAATDGCTAVPKLFLTSFLLNRQGRLLVSGRARCLTLKVLDGSAHVEAGVSGKSEPIAYDLEIGEEVRFCATSPFNGVLDGPASVVLGDFVASQQVYVPSIRTGNLSLLDTGQEVTLQQTLVLSMEAGDSAGIVAWTTDKGISVSAALNVTKVSTLLGARSNDLMPTLFAWFRGSPTLQAILSVLVGIVTLAWSWRDRLVS